jgi:ribose transport system permease protein
MKGLLGRLAPLLGLLAACALLTALTPAFLTVSNLSNILLQSSINGVLAVGMTFVILTGGIDLSVGSLVALAGVVLGSLLMRGEPVVVAVLGALATGGVCGLINGLLITRGNLPPFIATLGMMSAARGLALVYSGGRPISGFAPAFLALANGWVLVSLLVIIVAAGWFKLTQTAFGKAVYAVGGNEQAAWLSGIPTDRIKTWVYVMSGALSGLAATMLTARLNSAQAIAGIMYELDAIAAVVIGGTSLVGGEGSVLGTLVGALIMGVIRNGLNLLEVSSDMQQLVIGVVIVVAVLLDRSRDRLARWLEETVAARPTPAAVSAIAVLAVLCGGTWAWRGARGEHGDKAHQPQLAMVLKTLENPFWIDMKNASEAYASAHGARLVVQAGDRESDTERQMQIVENLIQQHVDALILAPSGSKEIVPAIRKANDAHIPVIIVDTRVDAATLAAAGAHIETYVGCPNEQGAKKGGEALGQAMGGHGHVLLLEGISGHETGDARKKGFVEGLAGFPGIQVVASQTANFEQEKAYNVTQNVLAADPTVTGICACNDVMAMGAVSALKSLGRHDVKVVGFDASDDARKAIAAGDMVGSVAQFPKEIGTLGVQAALDVLAHQHVEPEILTKAEVVTRDHGL